MMYKPSPLPPLAFRQKDDLAFHRELQRAANGYLQKRGEHRFADGKAFLKSALLVIACFSTYFVMLSSQGSVAFLLVTHCLFSLPYYWRSMWCMMPLIMRYFNADGRIDG
ncbi:Uncharacterised protein [Providencia alcalifaciens]|nr:Uncharacterised protein [Providencia alcalifaciens]